jgi:hypothetical protein
MFRLAYKEIPISFVFDGESYKNTFICHFNPPYLKMGYYTTRAGKNKLSFFRRGWSV